MYFIGVAMFLNHPILIFIISKFDLVNFVGQTLDVFFIHVCVYVYMMGMCTIDLDDLFFFIYLFIFKILI